MIYFLIKVWEYIFIRIWTILVKIKLWVWGIQVPKDLKSYGNLGIKRVPGSQIILGDNLTFRSHWRSNRIGINRRCMISTLSENALIQIGDKCGFSGTVIGAFTKVILGNNVRCGANTLITDSNWHQEDPRAGQSSPVIIEDNVWLGVNVIILKGVTIGENSLIGANSVVTKDIPPHSVAAGNPCKVIGGLNNE